MSRLNYHEKLKKSIPLFKHTKLLEVCRTRLVLHIDGLERFMEMYISLMRQCLKSEMGIRKIVLPTHMHNFLL